MSEKAESKKPANMCRCGHYYHQHNSEGNYVKCSKCSCKIKDIG